MQNFEVIPKISGQLRFKDALKTHRKGSDTRSLPFGYA